MESKKRKKSSSFELRNSLIYLGTVLLNKKYPTELDLVSVVVVVVVQGQARYLYAYAAGYGV